MVPAPVYKFWTPDLPDGQVVFYAGMPGTTVEKKRPCWRLQSGLTVHDPGNCLGTGVNLFIWTIQIDHVVLYVQIHYTAIVFLDRCHEQI
jgi:hypothetical protein